MYHRTLSTTITYCQFATQPELLKTLKSLRLLPKHEIPTPQVLATIKAKPKFAILEQREPHPSHPLSYTAVPNCPTLNPQA